MKDTSCAVSSPPSLQSMLTCFLPSLFFALMAAWLMVGVTVVGPMLDAQGMPVLDDFGQPVHVIHKWKTWLVNWRSLVCIAISGVLFLMPIVGWLRHGWQVWSSQRGPRLPAPGSS